MSKEFSIIFSASFGGISSILIVAVPSEDVWLFISPEESASTVWSFSLEEDTFAFGS